MQIDISKKQFSKIVTNYIEENFSTKDLELLIVNLIKKYTRWQGSDLDNISDYINQLIRKHKT